MSSSASPSPAAEGAEEVQVLGVKAPTPSRLRQGRVTEWGEVMTEERATKVIKANLEAIVYRFEPPNRLDDPFVRAALILANPGIEQWLKQDVTSYYPLIEEIDTDTSVQIVDQFDRILGLMTLAVDGVTVNGKSHLLYTLSKGIHAIFEKLQHLLDQVHVTGAEVDDCLQTIDAVLRKYNGEFANIAADNAAFTVLERVIDKLKQYRILLTRDSGHCIDLPCKDTGELQSLRPILDLAKNIIEFVNIDRVDSIIAKAVNRRQMLTPKKGSVWPKTRFYRVTDTLESAISYIPFLLCARQNAEFVEYYDSRSDDRKTSVDALLDECTPLNIRRLGRALTLFAPYKVANKMTSCRETPMSAYLPIVHALRNELNASLRTLPDWDSVFCHGSREQIADSNRPRFNFTGAPPNGRRVGLLDYYHIWCYLVDPFARDLQPQIPISRKAHHVQQMIDFYLPLPDLLADGSNRDEFDQVRSLALLCYFENPISFSLIFYFNRSKKEPFNKYTCVPNDAYNHVNYQCYRSQKCERVPRKIGSSSKFNRGHGRIFSLSPSHHHLRKVR